MHLRAVLSPLVGSQLSCTSRCTDNDTWAITWQNTHTGIMWHAPHVVAFTHCDHCVAVLQYYRVYSPVTFGKKYDPEGRFIRRFVPQLAQFPSKYIYEPWTAPVELQQR